MTTDNERRAQMIEDARYLIGRLNVQWLKDRNLDSMTDETLRVLTEEMWYAARHRAAWEENGGRK